MTHMILQWKLMPLYIDIQKDVDLFYISDTHLFHRNIIKYCSRPWLSDYEKATLYSTGDCNISDETFDKHNNGLIENINLKAHENAVLIHAGDIAFGLDNLIAVKERLKCKNVYVTCGNHDDWSNLCWVFGQDHVADVIIVRFDKKKHGKPSKGDHFISHYPHMSWLEMKRGVVHLHGHLHSKTPESSPHRSDARLLSFDIGVDGNNQQPYSKEDIKNLVDKNIKQWQEWRNSLKTRTIKS